MIYYYYTTTTTTTTTTAAAAAAAAAAATTTTTTITALTSTAGKFRQAGESFEKDVVVFMLEAITTFSESSGSRVRKYFHD